MVVLFFLGRSVEDRYGSKEFLRFYLAALVFANVAWCIVSRLTVPLPGHPGIYGASGAIAGVVVLFAFNFPNVTILLFFVIPMPAWLFGMGSSRTTSMGRWAATAVRTSPMWPTWPARRSLCSTISSDGILRASSGGSPLARSLFRPKPRLRIHKPPDEKPQSDDLAAEVDRILEKIYREGETSLTPKERSTLEDRQPEVSGAAGRKVSEAD